METQKPFYLANWVYHVKLQMMANVMELGFDQNLYETYEMAMIYWYMDYLYGVMREQAVRTRGLRASTCSLTIHQYKIIDGWLLGVVNKKKASKKQIPADFNYLDLEEALYSTAQELSRGLYRVRTAHIFPIYS